MAAGIQSYVNSERRIVFHTRTAFPAESTSVQQAKNQFYDIVSPKSNLDCHENNQASKHIIIPQAELKLRFYIGFLHHISVSCDPMATPRIRGLVFCQLTVAFGGRNPGTFATP
jgi:hypothetical protein